MNKTWTARQVKQHRSAAELCIKIMHESFKLIGSNLSISEYEVQKFIILKYKEYGMVSDNDPPIVAFRENTSFVHYFPEEHTSKRLENNSLIMIDLWARLDEKDAPYADITWMAWHGGAIPSEIQKGFDTILESRDSCVKYMQDSLNLGNNNLLNKDIAKSMEGIVLNSGLQDFLPHSFGHSLGLTSCHGIHGIFLQTSRSSLFRNMGYTIEPGIYIEGEYGFRSEIDFYIDKNDKLIISTEPQTEMELI